jgi:hypothetical protein
MSSERGCVSLDVKLSEPVITWFDIHFVLLHSFSWYVFLKATMKSSKTLLAEEDISYLGWIIKRPAKIWIVGKGFLHAVYSSSYVGLSQRDDFD